MKFSIEDRALLNRMYFSKHGTADDLEVFIKQCERTGLDPFLKQIHVTFRKDKDSGIYKMAVIISIDGFRMLAEQTGKYKGQTPTLWCGPDGVWSDVWLDSKTPPTAAKVGIIRSDFEEPLYAVVTWKSYNQNNFMWQKYDSTLLAKCGEALGFRKAFPMALSGLYIEEEFADNEVKEEEPTPEQAPVKEDIIPEVPAEEPAQPKNITMSAIIEILGKENISEEEFTKITGVKSLREANKTGTAATLVAILDKLKAHIINKGGEETHG